MLLEVGSRRRRRVRGGRGGVKLDDIKAWANNDNVKKLLVKFKHDEIDDKKNLLLLEKLLGDLPTHWHFELVQNVAGFASRNSPKVIQ